MTYLRLGSLIAGLCVFSAAHAITADELVQKNLDARGGADKLRAITALHQSGKFRLGGGLEAKIDSYQLAPGKVRFEFNLQGLTQVNAWDGTQGW